MRSCKFPTAFVTSSFIILMTTFPGIYEALLHLHRLFTSLCFCQEALVFYQICIMKPAMALWGSDVQLSNTLDVFIFLHSSVSNPDGMDPFLALIAAFLSNYSFMSSKITRSITGSSLLINVSS